ncbi:hypothetical protein [Duganella radicis]|uniref:TolB-like protein n=1 Tax=Duganella radicis TaxID=551988 RepID=A0A6L6PBH8_9BURK|nr:hypothetical protein [Duganella radicis]MTV36330.1 hypothetical protein [Duganella radicis]
MSFDNPEENIINHPALSLILRPETAPSSVPPCPDEAVRAALKLVICSKQFAKAHRCSALLSYLIERALNREDGTSPPEQEIGVAVFGRDRNSYYPGDDPIVRVQAGRLRLRLAAYYADEGSADPLRITVPLGSYLVRIALAEVKPDRPAVEAAPILMFSPLTCLSGEVPASSFTAGLNDELGYRLYRDFASFRLAGQDSLAREAGRQPTVHVLEGTVRQDAARLRVSLHLRHVEEGTVMWYEQFDNAGDGSIASQEQMAERCVQALRRHMLG